MMKDAPTIDSARNAQELCSALTGLYRAGQISDGQTRYESGGAQIKVAVRGDVIGSGKAFTLFYIDQNSPSVVLSVTPRNITFDRIHFSKIFGDTDPLVVAKDFIDTLRNGSQSRPAQGLDNHTVDLASAEMPTARSAYEISTPREAFEKLKARLGDQASVVARCPENIMDYVAIRSMSDGGRVVIEQSNYRYDGVIFSVEVRPDRAWTSPGDEHPSLGAEQRSLKTAADWLSNFDSWKSKKP